LEGHLTPSIRRLRLFFGVNNPSAVAVGRTRRRNRGAREGGGEKKVSNF